MAKENIKSVSDTTTSSSNTSALFKRPEIPAALVLGILILSYFTFTGPETEDSSSKVAERADDIAIELPVLRDNTDTQAIERESTALVNEDEAEPILRAEPLIEEELLTDSAPLSVTTDSAVDIADTTQVQIEGIEKEEIPLQDEAIEKTASVDIAAFENQTTRKPMLKSKDMTLAAPKPEKSNLTENNHKAVESWVFSKEPKQYTIQLIGSSNEKAIKDFVKTHQTTTNDLSYFHTVKDDKNWYVVVKGSYPSFTLAEEERKSLPQTLAKYGAWTRDYHSIQKEISANAEKIQMLTKSVATN